MRTPLYVHITALFLIHHKRIMVAFVETMPAALYKISALHQTLFIEQMSPTMSIMKIGFI